MQEVKQMTYEQREQIFSKEAINLDDMMADFAKHD